MSRVVASITFALVLCFMASPVLASPPADSDTLQVMARHVRDAHKIYTETSQIGFHGQRDLLLYSRQSWEQIVSYYRHAYSYGILLPENVICKGWMVFPKKRLATFTLYRGTEKVMVRATERLDGTQLEIYGIVYKRRHKYKRRPLQRPMPLRQLRKTGI